MRYAISGVAAALFCILGLNAQAGGLRENVLRKAAIDGGLIPTEQTHIAVHPDMVAAGKLLFQSKKLSLEHEIACASCHRDRFGSADGLPNAIGTEGRGEGTARLLGGGDIIPRNALPFWGRGSKGFNIFFWDGKVDARSGVIHSQFMGQEPSSDPLTVAVHLPPVEIGEMVLNSAQNEHLQGETVASANQLYDQLARRLREDPEIGPALAASSGKPYEAIQFVDVATAVAGFIRHNFRLKPTRLHQFVFGDGSLSKGEIEGGLLFYGKGRCAACHNGAYFSDLDFHAIPFPQAGFGRNGFGIDYGRYNVTLDTGDLYKFRTPPLYNVTKTAPYSHSGSVYALKDAIVAHIDPISAYREELATPSQRAAFYEQLKRWVDEPINGIHLDDGEVANLIDFLGALEFDSEAPVAERE